MEINDAIRMFLILAVELSVLFIGISLLVGAIQRHVPPSVIEARLSSGKGASYFLAAGLGAITPFCSCSTIPMLKGLIRARAGFGPLMVFLFASPLLNPVVVVLLIATFGWRLSAIYVAAAFLISLAAGWLFQALGFERFVIRGDAGAKAAEEDAEGSCCRAGGGPEEGVRVEPAAAGSCCGGGEEDVLDKNRAAAEGVDGGGCCSGCGDDASAEGRVSRYRGLWKESWSDFRDVLPYLLFGIAIGSLIYGFVPTVFLERHAGPGNPLAIPFAAVVGIPLYLRAEAVIPLAAALLDKGVGAGAVLALIIGSAGASLTELILLRALFRTKLLGGFVAVILVMAVSAGYAAQLFH